MRKGLFVGIDAYHHIKPLNGCVNDAMGMATVLARHANGKPNFSNIVKTTADSTLLKRTLEQNIRELFSGPADVALFFFAGHGSFDQTLDEGTILPQDYRGSGDGIRISDILNWASAATEIRNKILIFDCCQAGAAGESRQLRGGSSVLSDGITILTACKKEQVANEFQGHGLFTSLLMEGLQGGGGNVLGHITPGSLYSFVDGALGAWEQRPVFKTNVSSFCVLREMPPLVPLDTLRMRPTWLDTPQSVFPLDPGYEPEEDTFDPDKGAIFKQLQNCNRHSLVEPVDAEHMYFAAVNSTGCRLTALGAYYWSLAKKDRI